MASIHRLRPTGLVNEEDRKEAVVQPERCVKLFPRMNPHGI